MKTKREGVRKSFQGEGENQPIIEGKNNTNYVQSLEDRRSLPTQCIERGLGRGGVPGGDCKSSRYKREKKENISVGLHE